MEEALEHLCERAERRCMAATTSSSCPTALIGPDRIAIPALAGDSAVHHHLIRKGLRTSVGLVVETGEAREVHHFATLAGYGAEAINPYLAFDTSECMLPKGCSRGSRPRRSRQALHQGDRQGPAEGDVQDGHLDLPVLLRRADLRRGRPVEVGLRRKYFTGTPTHDRGRRPAEVAEETSRGTRSPSATIRSTATRWMSAANMPSAARRRPCLDARDRRRPAACGARQ
jgi:glutamate synthase (NADPH/NADH) large chain